MKSKILVLLTTSIFLLFNTFSVAHSASYDYGNIISNYDLFTFDSFTTDDIQKFLNNHQGKLKYHIDLDVDGNIKTAAQIISHAAELYRINPRYLIILLQKEQGLITDISPKQSQLNWSTGYALCDSCDADNYLVQKYKGFARQIHNAAWRTRYYYEHPDEFNFKAGQTYVIDGVSVHIKNAATAALYNYTPHLHGNEIFYKLWHSWFDVSEIPDGSLLQAYGQPGVWLIQNGQKHAFLTKAALTSRYRLQDVMSIDPSFLNDYPTSTPIKFPRFSLVQTTPQTIYLLADNQKRPIENKEIFMEMGFMLDEIIYATEDDLAFFETGLPINFQSLEPLGALLQDPESYGIFFVKDGEKKPLYAPELLSLNYPELKTRRASREELDKYRLGPPVLLKDGLLVKTVDDPKVFIIADGKKFPIDSESTFNNLGYKWINIQIVSKKLLNLHEEGDQLTILKPLSDQEADQLKLR